MKALVYKGIVFDDYAHEEGKYWATICEQCFIKHYDVLCYDVQDCGCPDTTCGVKGCYNCDDGQKFYYVDFDPEYVTFREVTESDNYDEQYI